MKPAWLTLVFWTLACCAAPVQQGGQCASCEDDQDCGDSALRCAVLAGGGGCCERRAFCDYDRDPACEDGQPCSVSSCGVDGMCVYEIQPNSCPVGDTCEDCASFIDPANCRVAACEPGVGCTSTLAPAGTACGPPRCEGSQHTGPSVCDATGQCVSPTPTDCAPLDQGCTRSVCSPDVGCDLSTRATMECGLGTQWGFVSTTYTPCGLGQLGWKHFLLDLRDIPMGTVYSSAGKSERPLSDVAVSTDPEHGYVRVDADGEKNYGSVNLDSALMVLKPEEIPGAMTIGVSIAEDHTPTAMAGRWLTWFVTYDNWQKPGKPHAVVGETVLAAGRGEDRQKVCVDSSGWSSGEAFGTGQASADYSNAGSYGLLKSDYNGFKEGCFAMEDNGKVAAQLGLLYGPIVTMRGWLGADRNTFVAALTSQVGNDWNTIGMIVMFRMLDEGMAPPMVGRYSLMTLGSNTGLRGMITLGQHSSSGSLWSNGSCFTCDKGRELFLEGTNVERKAFGYVEAGFGTQLWRGTASGSGQWANGGAYWYGSKTVGEVLVPESARLGILVRHPADTPWRPAPWDVAEKSWCP